MPYVGVTDYDWYRLHASKPTVDEVNFWKPSPDASFKALAVGEPFLFKLHAPRNYIAGGGFFRNFLQLPVSLAWDAFGEGNGARTLDEVRRRISKYRKVPIAPLDDPKIGCVLLMEPFFFPERDWIRCQADFALNTVQGKGYDLDSVTGRSLWEEVGERLDRLRVNAADTGPATRAVIEGARCGRPVVVTPRLGQGGFRVLVTDAYNRRCAITQERTLPVLEAAHIRPFSDGGPHELCNGLLLRSDLHRLFDAGYVAIHPDERRLMVSGRIREEFENGRDYYRLDGQPVMPPNDPACLPSREYLVYHAERFR